MTLDVDVARLAGWIENGAVMVLTGAGVSTDSGIPDYRDDAGQWKRGSPVQYRDFVASEALRRRYWARSMVGWQSFSTSQPNAAHRALSHLEQRGHLSLLVTQNVDGLHQGAGSQNVVDLHGRLDEVVCLTCGDRRSRAALQQQLISKNPDFLRLDAGQNPDGDAELAAADYERFELVDCERCGGVLKPDVVFFGERCRPCASPARSKLCSIRVCC